MSGLAQGACTVAVHVLEAQPDAEELDWQVSHRQRMRVEEHTCSAHGHPAYYELGWVGGALRIRRTRRGEVHDTPVVRPQQAVEWWRMLLAGRAR